MNFSIQPKLYRELKRSFYFIISIILISFVFFVTKYNETLQQKRSGAINQILKNNYFVELNEFIFQRINSPFLNVVHQVKKGESLNNVLKNYNIEESDVFNATKEIKKFIKPNKLKTGIILDFVIKKNISGSLNLVKLNLPVSKSINISLKRDINNKFAAKKIITLLFNMSSLSKKFIISSTSLGVVIPKEI